MFPKLPDDPFDAVVMVAGWLVWATFHWPTVRSVPPPTPPLTRRQKRQIRWGLWWSGWMNWFKGK